MTWKEIKNKRWFFGWENFKWFCREWMKMYSGNQHSFFSHKRVQTGTAFSLFIVGWGRVLVYLLSQPHTTILEFVEWSVPLLLICGYTLNKTEEAKTKKIQENGTPQ